MHRKSIDCESLLAQLSQFDSIIDVRSPSEFALDHLPGAVNCPVLDDEQRVEIGTMYQCVGPFDARRRAAAWVAANIAQHLRRCFPERPRAWTPVVYCWRGGERSTSMAYVMSRVGWRAHQLQGGYRSFRRLVLAALAELPARFRYRVLSGATGSGKSRLLAHLHRAGAQVLDLESLAAHRGSLLGGLPAQAQPSQKGFETRLWWSLRRLDPARIVYVESESRKIGDRQLPDALLQAMRRSACVRLELPLAERIRLLRGEYRHYEGSPEQLCLKLEGLTALHGRSRVERWKSLAHASEWDALVAGLLSEHYDPVYERSIASHYAGAADAIRLTMANAESSEFERAARRLASDD